MRSEQTFRKLISIIMPAAGIIFLLWYIKAAGADVIYSDYIRIVAEYLGDVRDIGRLLVPDILTRIPATFLARLINVSTFGYSVNFDRILGVFGIAIVAAVTAAYSYKYEIPPTWQAVIYIVIFSLIKWEILLNGTAWAHLVSMGLFFINYFLADRLWRGETEPREELLLFLMPFLLLLIAGEYIASYSVTMALVNIMGVLMGGVNSWAAKRGQSLFKGMLVATIAALGLYMLSRHYAVWEHSGATDMGICDTIRQYPSLIPVFFLKTFAGAVIGQETIAAFFAQGVPLPEALVIAMGAILLAAYIFAFFLYIRSGLYEVTIFPVILLISGFINHMLVTVSRWIFLSTDYALSSRYAGQFMVGIIGMLLIFAMYERQKRELRRVSQGHRTAMRLAAVCTAVLIAAGNCYTTYQEIKKARYREENYTAMYEAVANYRDYEPDELASILEWTKDTSIMYDAIEILEEGKLNVFGRPGA